MTTPDTYLSRVDSSHVWTVCAEATGRSHGTLVTAGDNYGARVCLPTRADARTAQAALARVGYQVVPSSTSRRGHDLTVYGWSAQGLDARLAALRGVLTRLGSEPGATAAVILDGLRDVPLCALPDEAGRQELVQDAARRLRAWISAASGVHAPCDPAARPADAGCALRLSAAWRAEAVIDELGGRQLRVAWHALALYPGLRRRTDHEAARDSALREAGVTACATGRLAADSTPLMRGGRHAAPPRRPWSRIGPADGAAHIFRFPQGPAASPVPPDAPASGLRGRNFPSGSAGRRP